MALLNPPEIRMSVIGLLIGALEMKRGNRDVEARLLTAIAPAGLGGADPQRDVKRNLVAAIDLGLIRRDSEDLVLDEVTAVAYRKGHSATTAHIRRQVLDPARNTAGWGGQTGSRDLSNALSWFLSHPMGSGPINMEGGSSRTAKDLQTRDFGPRQSDSDDDASGWPIGNQARWGCFRRWACSLGFAWVAPNGNLVADPTSAIAQTLKDAFAPGDVLPASEFLSRLARELPVLDGGAYRLFVESNWRRPPDERGRTSAALTEALHRLQQDGNLQLEDRADAAKTALADGSTVSHVRLGPTR